MIEYIKASDNDRAELIDFINYVFSYEYIPHDFKKLLPKAYSDELEALGAEHYIVKEDGKIRAVVANRLMDADYYGSRLKIGAIGSVAVHPYSRGKGYMKKLMKMAMDDAAKMGAELLILSGRRQRYGYFGFENGGIVYNFSVSSSNIRHALAEVDTSAISYKEMTAEDGDDLRLACRIADSRPYRVIRNEDEFLRIMNSWSQKSHFIYSDGELIGYSFGKFTELVLKDESYYPAVIKAMFGNSDNVNIPASPFDREKIRFLSSICESYSIGHIEKICVLDWKAVTSALLNAKSRITVLSDGEKSFDIAGKRFSVSVKNNKVGVADSAADRDTKVLSHNGAERLFFELDGLLNGGEYGNWFPLPFYVDNADTF